MSFYAGAHAALYDLIYADKPYDSEAAFVLETIAHFSGRRPEAVLELACGTGRHAIAMAGRGCRVTAFDISADMIEVARANAKHAGAAIELRQDDMTRFDAPAAAFDAAVCLFDSIGYVRTDANLREVFGRVRRSLKPGGIFMFEYWHARAMRRHFEPVRIRRFPHPAGEVIRMAETRIDEARSLAEVRYDIVDLGRDGTWRRVKESQTNRFFEVSEMAAFAAACGFDPLATYAGFARDGAITDETWHVVEAWRVKQAGAP